MAKETESKSITKKKGLAGRQQYNKAIELPDAALGAGVSAPKRDGTGDVNAGPIFQPKGGCMSKGASPQDSQPADKCPEVEIITEVEKEKQARAMGDVELCDFITKRLSPARKILRDSIPYLQEARKRFAQPGRRVPVPGKPTWGKWIKQNLGFSERHVRRLLAGEHNPKKGRSKKSDRRAEHTGTIAKGDAEALASLWQKALGSLTQMQRREVLARFFKLIPEEQISEIAAAIEAGNERRVSSGRVIGADEISGSEPQKLDAPVSPLSVAQEPSPMAGKIGTPVSKGSREMSKKAKLATPDDRETASHARLASDNRRPPASDQTRKPKTAKKPKPQMKPPKVKRCPAALSPGAVEHIRWMETVISEQPGARQGDYVLNELGKWEFDPDAGGEGLHDKRKVA